MLPSVVLFLLSEGQQQARVICRFDRFETHLRITELTLQIDVRVSFHWFTFQVKDTAMNAVQMVATTVKIRRSSLSAARCLHRNAMNKAMETSFLTDVRGVKPSYR